MLDDCCEVPEVWSCGDEAFLAWGEEEVPQGDGEEHQGVQGGDAGPGYAKEDYGPAGEGQAWGEEDTPDKLLQVTCRNQVSIKTNNIILGHV